MSNLDDDILIEILARLPAKALLQFKCVCRRWHSLISGPALAKAHLRMSLQENPNPPQRLLYYDFPQSLSVNISEALGSCEDAPECTLLDTGSIYRKGRFRGIVGSCHGLQCLRSCQHRFFLYNPTTRESHELPKPLHLCKTDSGAISGLGYDALNDDYKFIIGTHNGQTKHMRTFNIYSLKSGTWRCIGEYDRRFNIDSYGCYAKGYLYWLARGVAVKSIVSFNIAAEEFCEDLLALPTFRNPIGSTQLRVSETGWLFLCRTWCDSSEVWIMKDGRDLNSAWIKLCHFSNEQVCKDLPPYMSPLIKDGRIVILCMSLWGCHRFGIYDPEEESWKISKFPRVPRCNYRHRITYVESLVSLAPW